MADFSRARRKYRPRKVRFLLIAESPPSSGGFFYFPTTIGKDHLFRETMKALKFWPENEPMRRGVDKSSMLRRFRSMGFYLLDTCVSPVDKMPPGERRTAVQNQTPRLVNEVIEADPSHIFVVKSSIFRPVSQALREAGMHKRVINTIAVPFPSHGNQRVYRARLRRALRVARLLHLKNICHCGLQLQPAAWLRQMEERLAHFRLTLLRRSFVLRRFIPLNVWDDKEGFLARGRAKRSC